MADTPRPHHSSHDEPEDAQQRFGTAVWVWTVGSAILMLVLVIMLIMSLTGFWQNDWISPPV